MNKTVFLIDSFNVYHSLIDAQKDAKGATTKWLDLRRLCDSYLPIAGQIAKERATLERIYYFSAPPTHRSKDRLHRHSLYIKCLKAAGLNIELGRFRPKDVFCNKCKSYFVAHEEKETDVAICARLFEVCQANEVKTIILMTGDTDLAPAIRTCKRLYPNKFIFLPSPTKEPIWN